MISDDIILDWIQLINTKNIGIKTFWRLVKKYKTAKEALKAVPAPFSRKSSECILKYSKSNILLAIDPRFPPELKLSEYCPPILFYKGNLEVLHKNKLAIIGARNASVIGMKIAEKFSRYLSQNLLITSGMARGIDTEALKGALTDGPALAVLPFGFDNIYPKENIKLFEEIVDKGLVLTSVPFGAVPDPSLFFARNRIIVLLTKKVCIIEAALKSGTMATAKLAMDTGSEVFVVPGSPLDPRYFGSNYLIQNGAHLVQTAQEIINLLEYDHAPQPVTHMQLELQVQNEDNHEITDEYKKILIKMSSVPITIDELYAATNIQIPQLLSLLSTLEIENKIARTAHDEFILL